MNDYSSKDKKCPRCKGYFPPTLEYWHKHSKAKDGLQAYCKTCCLSKNKAWREENNRSEYHYSYHKNHAEEIRQRKRDSYRADPEKQRQRVKNYRLRNPKYHHNYHKNNREKTRFKKFKRLGLLLKGTHTETEILELYENQGGMCFYCSEPLGNDYHKDHYIPISKGGSNYIDNIVLACSPCNLSKADKLPSEWEGRFSY